MSALVWVAVVVFVYVGVIALILAAMMRRLRDDEDLALAEEFIAQLRSLPDQDWPF